MILGEIHKLYREPYYANPLYDVSHIYMKPTLFKSITRFEPEVFVEQLLQPLFGVCEYPRGYHLGMDTDDDIDDIDQSSFKQRRCQVDNAQRVFRWCMVMRGIDPIVCG